MEFGDGGNFLLVPPGYDGDVPSGYDEVRATMHNHYLLGAASSVLSPGSAREPAGGGLLVLTAYDSATRSMIQNPTNDAAHASYDELTTNADGSFDMYIGPTAPAGTC